MDAINIVPWAGLAAFITAALLIFRHRSEVRSVDAEAWNKNIVSQRNLQEQVNTLSAELMKVQKESREAISALYVQMDAMETEYRKREDMYQSQIDSMRREHKAEIDSLKRKYTKEIQSLQARIKELENGKNGY